MNFRRLAAKLGLDEEEYLDLLKLFIETSLSDMHRLQLALEEGDASEVISAAHSLKGASANLRLSNFYASANDVEEKARRNHLPGLAESVQRMNRSLAAIIDLTEGKKTSSQL